MTELVHVSELTLGDKVKTESDGRYGEVIANVTDQWHYLCIRFMNDTYSFPLPVRVTEDNESYNFYIVSEDEYICAKLTGQPHD